MISYDYVDIPTFLSAFFTLCSLVVFIFVLFFFVLVSGNTCLFICEFYLQVPNQTAAAV